MAKLPPMPDADQVLIDQHLSAALSGPGAAEFARRLETDPAFAAVVARHESFSASLTRSVPGPDADLARAQLARAQRALDNERSEPRPALRIFRRTSLIAAAACLLLAFGVAGWLGVIPLGGFNSSNTSPLARISADGFGPAIAISDPAELELTLAQKLGTALKLPRDTDITYLGIRSDVNASPVGLGILAIVNGEQVLLVLDNAKTACTLPISLSATEFRHDRDLGGLHLTEWSRSRVPVLMDRVAIASR